MNKTNWIKKYLLLISILIIIFSMFNVSVFAETSSLNKSLLNIKNHNLNVSIEDSNIILEDNTFNNDVVLHLINNNQEDIYVELTKLNNYNDTILLPEGSYGINDIYIINEGNIDESYFGFIELDYSLHPDIINQNGEIELYKDDSIKLTINKYMLNNSEEYSKETNENINSKTTNNNYFIIGFLVLVLLSVFSLQYRVYKHKEEFDKK